MIIEAIPGSSIKFPSPHNSLLGGQSTIKKYFDSRCTQKFGGRCPITKGLTVSSVYFNLGHTKCDINSKPHDGKLTILL